MTILVTGGAGYIGSHVVLELTNSDQEIVIIDNLSIGRRPEIAKGIPLYTGDIGDAGLITRVCEAHDITSVIHMAAITSNAYSNSNPLETYLTNTAKSAVLLDTAIKAGVKNFVFSSVSAVYGSPSKQIVSELDDVEPDTAYGKSKLFFEQILKETGKTTDLTYAILRCFNVAGVDKDQRVPQWPDSPTHLVKLAAMASIGITESIVVNGNNHDTPDGTCIRDYVHVSDVATGHVQALNHLREGKPSLTANLGSGIGYSVKQIIDIAKKIGGYDFEIINGDKRPGDPSMIISNPTIAQSVLKWSPKYNNIEEIIASAIEWEKSCRNL